MPNMQERLDAAVDKAEVDTGLLHDVVHGSITTEVTTEGGKVPSVAKVIHDIRESIHSETSDLVGQAQTAATIATEQATNSAISATQASESVNTCREVIKEAQTWAEGSDEEIAAIGGQHSCREWVKLAESSVRGNFPTTISGVATANQSNLPLPEAIYSFEQILSVNIENVSLMPETYILSNDRKNVVLQYPLSAGERWSVKYLTDFESISGVLDSVLYEDM